jgi:hypothetical protein
VDRKNGGGSRKKRVTGDASGGGVFRRGSAVNPKGGKPVGKADGYADRKQGSSNPLSALFGSSDTGGGSGVASDLWAIAWNAFFVNADFSSFTGALTGNQTNWVDQNQIQSSADYYQKNYLDATSIKLTQKGNTQVLKLTDEQWDLIQTIELNIFFDDGQGYIDLGLDNVYEFDRDGDLVIDFDGTWLALDNHVVAYYVESIEETGDNWSITGRIPAMLNGMLVDIIVHFNNDYPYGVVAGARINYGDVTDTVAKGLIEINRGDVIDFLCDFYSYDQEYNDSYYLGEQMTVTGDLIVSNVNIGDDRCLVTYRLTDIYNNTYWTPAVVAPAGELARPKLWAIAAPTIMPITNMEAS